MFKLLLGSITSAPLPDGPTDVLDLGCGTGIWCGQFAELHPSAKVLGVDVAPPSLANSDNPALKNCDFVQADIEQAWHFADSRTFDLIYARLLVIAIKDWRRLFERAYSSLRPGGVLELLEAGLIFTADDETAVKDSAMARWWALLRDFNVAKNLDVGAILNFNKLLQDCGFKMVEDEPVKLYMDPEVAARHGIRNADRVAVQASSDCRGMVVNATEKVLNTPDQQALAAEALEDLEKNSGRRGYYMLWYHPNHHVSCLLARAKLSPQFPQGRPETPRIVVEQLLFFDVYSRT